MTTSFGPKSLMLVCGLVFSGCTSVTTAKIHHAIENLGDSSDTECSTFSCSDRTQNPPRTSFEINVTRAATDCSPYSEVSNLSALKLPEATKIKLPQIYQRHHQELNMRVLREEARQLLIESEDLFDGRLGGSSGVVSKFTGRAIPIFVYARNRADMVHAEIAIERINATIKPTRLEAETHRYSPGATPPMSGGKSGIHLYFGAEECIRRVFAEQAGISEAEFASSDKFQFDKLGGITLLQTLTVNGVPTGEIQQSFVVVLNIQDKLTKQSVVEHELMHALGIPGHTRSTLWSRMSVEATSIAPLSFPSAFDEILLKALYRDLKPGDGSERVNNVMEGRIRFSCKPLASIPDCAKGFARRQNRGESFSPNDLVENVLCLPSIRAKQN